MAVCAQIECVGARTAAGGCVGSGITLVLVDITESRRQPWLVGSYELVTSIIDHCWGHV